MASNDGESRAVKGDRKATLGSPGNDPLASGDAGGAGNPPPHRLNKAWSGYAFLRGTGELELSTATIYAAALSQHPILNRNGNFNVYHEGCKVYAGADADYLTLVPTIIPGAAFSAGPQAFAIGTAGSTRPHLAYDYKQEVIVNHPVAANNNLGMYRINCQADGGTAPWFIYCYFSIRGAEAVALASTVPFLAGVSGVVLEELNETTAKEIAQRIKNEMTRMKQIKRLKDLQMPTIDQA